MVKKIIAAILMLVMLAGYCGCGMIFGHKSMVYAYERGKKSMVNEPGMGYQEGRNKHRLAIWMPAE